MLRAGLLLLLTLAATAELQNVEVNGNSMRVADEAEMRHVLFGDDPLLHYRYGDVPYKPYIAEAFTPAGVNVLRDAPHDHLHHHALMFAVSIDGISFWEEQTAPGRQEHRRFEETQTASKGGVLWTRITEHLDWVNPRKDDVHAQEVRTIAAARLGDEATLIDWESRFTLPEGKDEAVFGGSHYYGLGMRFVESMDKGRTHINATGEFGSIVPIDDPNAQPGPDLDWEAFLGDSPKRDFDVSRYFRWRMYEDYAGGPSTDLFPHSLTPVMSMLGLTFPSAVVATGGKFRYEEREIPDTFNMLVDYPENLTIAVLGTQGNNYQGAGSRGAGGRIPVVRGWEGTLTVDDQEAESIVI